MQQANRWMRDNPAQRWLADKERLVRGAIKSVLGSAIADEAINSLGSGPVKLAYNYAKPYLRSSNNTSSNGTRRNNNSGKYKRSRSNMSPYRSKRVKTNLDSRVKELEKAVKDGEGTLIYRKLVSGRMLASVNQANHGHFSLNYQSFIETALANLRFFNPATPGTYTTVDLTSGTNSKAARLKCYSKCIVTNNYQVPAMVCLYICAPKEDTNNNTTSCIDNGLADSSSGPLTITNPSVYPQDSLQFRDLWKIMKSQCKVLMPGDTMIISDSTPYFEYDPSYADSQTQLYQPRNECRALLVRVQGVLGHDTANNEQGLLACGVDVQLNINYTVKYEAGARITYYIESSALSSFTNSGVVSEKPVADNIGYSVS